MAMDRRRCPAICRRPSYTYAAEYSFDEAIDSDAETVTFSEPVVGYLDNFIELPVGEDVPVGSFDRERGVWVPEVDGRVVEVLSESGGQAVLDVDGSAQAASQGELDELGVTAAELTKVAQLYAPGDELWRTAHEHFTPVDYNFRWSPRRRAASGRALAPADPDAECQDRVRSSTARARASARRCRCRYWLGASLPKHRSPGRANVLDVPLIDDDIPEA